MTAKYDFPPIKTGDTFRSRQISINYSGQPADLSDAVIKMQLKTNANGPAMKDLEPYVSGDGMLTIPSFKVELYPRVYLYDLEITLNNGYTLTYMEGKFPVTQDISR